MRFVFCILCFFLFLPLFAQVTPEEEEPVKLDSLPPVADPLYREDQFYASISYNLVQGRPKGFTQNAFSTGITAGFLRDMPVNKARNRAVAIGFGYSYNNIHDNLKVSETDGKKAYEIVSGTSFSKNKLVLHYVEIPLEFRWRNSDSISHKFWRIYAGFKVSYLFADKAQFYSNGHDAKVKDDADLNKFIYGVYLSTGWNTWNLYAYYGLTPIYKSAMLAPDEKIKLHSLNLGLVFYIL